MTRNIDADQLQAFAFMLVILMVIVFVFRILAPRIILFLAPGLEDDKKGKCCVYITELIFSTLALVVVVASGSWDPNWLFDFEEETGDALYRISSAELAAAWICAAMYVVELSGEPHMRISLLAHHFAFCSRVLGAVVELSIMPDWYGRAGARMVACWLWLPITEQNVFVTMLAYRMNPHLAAWSMKLSAALYMATRVFGIGISLIAFGFYMKVGFEALDNCPGCEVIFALCVSLQTVGFVVMMWAQYSSAKSQWGLSQKQSAKLANAHDIVKKQANEISDDIQSSATAL